MSKHKEPYYYKEEHTYYCIIEDADENSFVGVAVCHEDDWDMESEKVGYFIAGTRAQIKLLQHFKKNVLKQELKALNNLYYSMNRSKYFNPKSYEAKRMFRHMNMLQDDIEYVDNTLKVVKEELRNYLVKKEEFRQDIRKLRAAQKAEKDD